MSSGVVYVGPQARALSVLDSSDYHVLGVERLDQTTLADERVGYVVVDPDADPDPDPLARSDVTVLTTDGSDLPDAVVDERATADGDPPAALAARLDEIVADEPADAPLHSRLAALQETTRELIVAPTGESVAETAVSAAESVLDMPATSLWTYDEGENCLLPTAMTDTVRTVYDGDPPPIEPDDERLWPLYEHGEFRVFEDITYRIGATDTVVRSAIVAPLGEQGLLITATESGSFDETETELFRLLASAAGSALSRTERERELQRQNERLDQFTSVVSHDLQTPIQLAVTQLELYRETGDETHLDELASAHDRMMALVGDLLTLARQGDTVDATHRIALSTVAEDAWQGIDSGRSRLEIDADATVEADPGRLDQLFSNLFTNAIEHAEGPVTVSVGCLPEAAGFYVADDGPGIPTIDREQIFERGYTTSDTGTGFGLSIVAEIVDAHGWSIDVRENPVGDGADDSDASAPGSSGARFEITGVSSLER